MPGPPDNIKGSLEAKKSQGPLRMEIPSGAYSGAVPYALCCLGKEGGRGEEKAREDSALARQETNLQIKYK